MTTSTRPRKLNRPELIKWQTTPDPDTGEFPSYEQLRLRVLAEHGVEVSRGAVQKAVVEYRSANGLPPAPRAGSHLLPWRLPRAHHDDWYGYRLHRFARRALAGSDAELHAKEVSALAEFDRHLARLGDRTVVSFDPAGGWVVRQAVDREDVWYGVMAVKPYPPGSR